MSLEELRKKRSEELQQQASQQKQEQDKARAVEQQLEAMLKQLLSKEAKDRLANVKLVNKELYFLASRYLIQLVNSGQMQGKVSETEIKKILEKLSATGRKEIKITRK